MLGKLFCGTDIIYWSPFVVDRISKFKCNLIRALIPLWDHGGARSRAAKHKTLNTDRNILEDSY